MTGSANVQGRRTQSKWMATRGAPIGEEELRNVKAGIEDEDPGVAHSDSSGASVPSNEWGGYGLSGRRMVDSQNRVASK